MSGSKSQTYEFNNFRLEVGERRLLRDGEPVVLSSKAFELLTMLVENNGRLIGKEELYAQVWKDQIVEESNLTVQMSAIRRALGERRGEQNYINTVIGSGYRFTADVREIGEADDEILVVESDTIERIIIEREEQCSETRDGFTVGALQARPKRGFFVVAAIGLAFASVIAGLWIYRDNFGASADTSNRQMTMIRLTDGKPLGAATISPDGRFVAYIQNAAGGTGSLYLQQTDTNTVVEMLSPGERTYGCLNFSPDSSLLYYIVFDGRDPDAALYSMPVLGGTPKRILGNLAACFALSPDGKHVAFRRGNPETKRGSLIIAALDGSNERVLMDYAHDEVSFGLGLAWSPDGKAIAFAHDTKPNDLVAEFSFSEIDVASSATRSLAAEQFSGVGKICWTGDGSSLIFVASRTGPEQKIYSMNYASGEVSQISGELESYGNYGLGVTADSTGLVAGVYERKSEIWSVDSGGDASKAVNVARGAANGLLGITGLATGRIAYIARIAGNQDVWTALDDGSQAKALTTDAFVDSHVAASPDGRYLVFASERAGSSHIFRMNADDGSQVTQLSFGDHASDSRPDVSPDGKWVVYHSVSHVASIGKISSIWKVPLDGGEAVRLTDYESGSPVFSPDGRQIACVLRSNNRTRDGFIAVISADGGPPQQQTQVLPFEYSYQTIRWTPDGSGVVFRRADKSGAGNLWLQPISGGSPRQLTDFTSDALWNFAYSHDGKRILVSRGHTFVDIVLIKNFR